MKVFIYVFIVWLIGVIASISFVKGANKKYDENYRED